MSISNGNRRVWVTLVDSSGAAFKDSSAFKVSLPSSADVDDLRDAVHAKYNMPGYLKDIPSGVLKVYRDAAHFHARNLEGPLKASTSLKGSEDSDEKAPGKSEENALIVLVPNVANRVLFFRFVDSSRSYGITSVSLSPTATTIGDFTQSVFSLNTHALFGVSQGSIKVFQNLSIYNQKSDEPLEGAFPIQDLGKSEEEPLIVWYPIEESIGYQFLAYVKSIRLMSHFQLLGPPTESVKSTRTDKNEWLKYYGMESVKENENKRYCHLLGVTVPSKYAAFSHLYQQRWQSHAKKIGLDKIHSPDNILVLLKIFEEAFDYGRMIFLVDKSTDRVTIRCKILDDTLRSVSLKVAMKKKFPAFNPGEIDFNGKVCFGDLDGQELHFQNENRPRSRYLLFHAQIARLAAIQRGWIVGNALPELDDNDLWSDDIRESDFVAGIKSWAQGVPSFSFLEEDTNSIIPPHSSVGEDADMIAHPHSFIDEDTD
jgi:hypothetical protein